MPVVCFSIQGAHQTSLTLQDKIQTATVEKEVIYNVYESTNRLFLPKRWQTWTLISPSPTAAATRSRLNSTEDAAATAAANGSATTVATRSSDGGASSSITTSTATEDHIYTFDSHNAEHTTFKMYVANKHPHSSVRLDVMCETLTGHTRRYVPIA